MTIVTIVTIIIVTIVIMLPKQQPRPRKQRRNDPAQTVVVGVGEQDVEEHVQQRRRQQTNLVHSGGHVALAAGETSNIGKMQEWIVVVM